MLLFHVLVPYDYDVGRDAHFDSNHFAKRVEGASNARQNISDHQKMIGTYAADDTM